MAPKIKWRKPMNRHNYLVISAIFLIIAIICLLWSYQSYAYETKLGVGNTPPADTEKTQVYVTNDNLAIKQSKPGHEMILTSDGQVLLDGVPIEKLDTPEIRKILAEILKEIQSQSNIDYFSRQTDYLLQEIGQCRERLKLCEERKIR